MKISEEMSDTSEDFSGESAWVFYADRPEWADVTPLEQDDGPLSIPVVRIAYSDRCKNF